MKAKQESEAGMSGWVNYLDLKYALKAMADSARLNILHQLAGERETNVTELVEALEMSQPLVSWHLRSLRRAGLVLTRRRGREVYCSLDIARFAACQRALSELVAPPGSPPGSPPDAAPDHQPPQETQEPRISPLSGPLAAPMLGGGGLGTTGEMSRSSTGRPRGRPQARAGPGDG